MAEKILVLLDHSLQSNYALRFACTLGRKREGEVEIMHVIQSFPHPLTSGSGWARRHWERDQIDQMMKEFGRMVESEGRCKDLNIVSLITIGSVSGEVSKQLKKEVSYEIVISGVHYSEVLHKPYLGRLHTHLINESPYPLALVSSFKPAQKLLLYMDGTVPWERIKGFIKKFFAEVEVLVVGNSEYVLSEIKEIETKVLISSENTAEKLRSEAQNVEVIMLGSDDTHVLFSLTKYILPETLGAIILFK
jgi:nucleotide-binding universal stress UspA family protein